MSISIFTANDGINGTELWASNGTPAGTTLLKNINPGGSSNPGNLFYAGSYVYFQASDGTGTYLWRTDGTTAGTVQLTDGGSGGNPASVLTPVGGNLFYYGSDSTNGTGLFRIDGLDGAVSFVAAINGMSRPTVVGNTLFFLSSDGTNGTELWKSDGTAGGTSLVKDVWPGGNSSSIDQLTAAGAKLYFTANDGTSGTEIWVSDGTAAGTHRVQDLNGGPNSSSPNQLVSVNGTIYFRANDGAHGTQLYSSDGTTVTQLTSYTGSAPDMLTALNGKLYFNYNDGTNGAGLYSYDGSNLVKASPFPFFYDASYMKAFGSAIIYYSGSYAGSDNHTHVFDGTNSVDLGAGWLDNAVVSGSQIFFTRSDGNGNELWVSDGTEAGTHLIKDINPGGDSSSPTNMSPVAGGVVFTATGADGDREVYFSDGTSANTQLIKNVNTTANLSPSLGYNTLAVTAGTNSYFSGSDGIHGNELWVTDGQPGAGHTHQVADLRSGATGSNPSEFTSVNGAIYFVANDGVNGTELYTSDGTTVTRITTGGTTPEILTAFNGKLYFNYNDGTNGYGLYSYDGTTLVKASPFPFHYDTSTIKVLGSTLVYYSGYYSGADGHTHAFDGTNSVDLGGGTFDNAVVSGSRIFFTRNDGNGNGQHGNELWVSDGTLAGTQRVTDINPDQYDSNPQNITPTVNGVIFTAVNDSGEREVYVTDGTTTTLYNVNPTQNPAASLGYSTLAVTAGTNSYFSGSDGIHGNEVWVTDGQPGAGHTRQVADLRSGATGSNPSEFTSVNGAIYFVANDGVNGTELYTSDGTTVTRITTGGTTPEILTAFNGKLYFNYNDGTNGYGLYSYDGTTVVKASPFPFHYDTSTIKVLGSTLVYYSGYYSGADGHTHAFDGINSVDLGGGTFDNAVVSGSRIFFTRNDGNGNGQHGNELWVSDGTLAGTQRVTDINPDQYDSNPQNITPTVNGVIFTAVNDSGEREVYVTDGTTTTLYNVNPTQNPAASLGYSTLAVTAGTNSYFSGSDGIHGNEVWVTDGQPGAGHTRQVADLRSGATGSNPSEFTSVNGTIYFVANDGVNGTELYTSDGTTVTRITTGGTTPEILTAFNGKLYFNYNDGTNGYGLYSYDGTTVVKASPFPFHYDTSTIKVLGSTLVYYSGYYSGADGHTHAFDGINSVDLGGGWLDNVVASGSNYFFTRGDGSGNELWVSNGTLAGTHIVADINPAGASADPASIVAFKTGVAFLANDGTHGQELWFSDGTVTQLVKDINTDTVANSGNASIQNLTVLGNQLFFSAYTPATGQELWVSDGTDAGTHLVKEVIAGTSGFSVSNFFTFGGRFYFIGNDGVNGVQLWTSDGTAANTNPVSTNFNGANPSAFTAVGNQLFYKGYDSVHSYGLFVIDAATGTISHVPLGAAEPYYVGNMVAANGRLLFTSSEGVNGGELYVTDGTTTTRLSDVGTPNSSGAGNFVYAGGKAYFVAGDGTHGRELFVYDGTTTTLVKDINPNGAGSSDPSGLIAFNGKLYFTANDGTNGWQLWTTDGTSAGTQAVSDNQNGANPSSFTVVGNQLFYKGYDNAHSYGLFVVDGTTGVVSHVPLGAVEPYYVGNMVAANGRLLFTSSDPVNGGELFVTDGITTTRVSDVGTPNSSSAANFAYAGGKAYFVANDGSHGRELFVYDGTTTTLVKDINPNGAGSSDPSSLFVFNDKLYFTANDGANGWQLWTTDGTAAGTHALSDNSNGANPNSFTVVGNQLFYKGYDNAHSYGLFFVDGTTGIVSHVPLGAIEPYYVGNMVAANGKLLFTSTEGANGGELFVTDGTTTTRVTDINVPVSSNAANFTFLANVAPTLTGAAAGQATDDKTAIAPFANVTIDDADAPAQTQTVTVSVDDVHKGAFTAASLTASGFVDGGAGIYTFAGTADQATTAIRVLQFQPVENRVAVGASETAQFTISVNDGAGGGATNAITSVVATSVNDAPVPVADVNSVVEDATVATTTRAAGVLGNDADPDLGTAAGFTTGNLLSNPGAETSMPDGQGHDLATGWTTSNLYSILYGPNIPAADEPADGARHFTGSDQGGNGTATQTINVAAYSADIDLGGTTVTLGGQFGGFQNEDDHAGMTATFLDANGHAISTTAPVGDVLAADRGNVTTLLERSGTFNVPVGTRSILVTLTAAKVTGDGADGYADNLSLTLTAPTRHESADLVVSGAHYGAAADTAVPGDNSPVDIVGLYGTLTMHADGTYAYTPNLTAAQQLPLGAPATEQFSYTARDPHGVEAVSTLTFSITGQNDVPTVSGALADAKNEGDSVAILDLLRNASDVDTGETAGLSVDNVTFAVDGGSPSGAAPAGVSRSGASLTVDAANAAFDHLAAGATQTIIVDYDIKDVNNATVHQTDTITIIGTNDGPVGNDDANDAIEKGGPANGAGGSGASGNVLTNDTDVDVGDTRTVSAATVGGNPIALNTPVATAHGTITLHTDGSYTYAVDETDNDVQKLRTSADTITDTIVYTVKDDHDATATANLVITIHGANDDPVAVADTADATEKGGTTNGLGGSDAAGNVLTNDTDVDAGDSKTVTAVSIGAVNGTVDAALTGMHGTLTLHTDGTYTYAIDEADAAVQALNAGSTPLTDTFSYTVRDTALATASASLTISIHGANDAPRVSAAATIADALEDHARAFSVTLSDVDSLTGTATVSILHGKLTIANGAGYTVTGGNGTGSVTLTLSTATLNTNVVVSGSYLGNQDFNGADTLTTVVTDSGGLSDTATTSITVGPVNDAPSFTLGSTQSVLEDAGPQEVTGFVSNIALGPTADENTQNVDFIVTNNNAELFSVAPTIDASGKLTYTTAVNANGSAIITVKAHDDGGTGNDGVDTSAPQTFTITVTPVNDAPAGANATRAIDEDHTYVFQLADFALTDPSDTPANILQAVKITTLPTGGALALNNAAVTIGQVVAASDIAAGQLIFTPTADLNGTAAASFTFQVRDSGGMSDGGINLDPSPNTFAFDIAPVNDAPTVVGATATLGTIAEDTTDPSGDTVASLFAAHLSDTADNSGGSSANAFAGVAITAIAAGAQGTWQYSTNGTTWTAVAGVSTGHALLLDTAAHLRFVPAANYYGAVPSLTAHLIDASGTAFATGGYGDLTTTGGTTAYSSATVTLGETVTPVHDLPTTQSVALTTEEDTPYVFQLADFHFADQADNPDPDALANVIIVSLPSAGTLMLDADGVGAGLAEAIVEGQSIAVGDIAAGHVSFVPAANGHASAYASFQFQVQDGGATNNTSATATATIDVTAVNDPVGVSASPSAALAEDASVAVSGLVISDDDAALDPAGLYAVALSASRGKLTLDTIAGLTFDAGTVNGSGSLNFHGTLAAINAALATTTYAGAPDHNGADTILFTATDSHAGTVASGAGSATHASTSIAVVISAVNDAPVIIGGTAVTLGAIDEDNANPAGDTVANLFGAHFSDTADQVTDGSGANALAGVAVAANATTSEGAWEYSADGTSFSALPAVALDGAFLLAASAHLRFVPAHDYNGPAPLLTVHLVDGSSGAITTGDTADLTTTGGITPYSSGALTLGETITAINDAPTVTNLPATLTLAEDAAPLLLFTNGPVVSDVDSASVTVTLTLADIASGALTGAGPGTAGVYTVTGTLASVNAALAAVKFAPAADYNGSTSVTVDITDGHTGPQGANPHATVSITVTEENDAPLTTSDTLPTIAEDAGVQTITFDALTGNDAAGPGNEGSQSLTVTDAFGAVGGTVTVNAGHVAFTPTANFSGIASFDYTVTDGGTTNGLDDFKSTTGHASFTITAVNDDPTAAIGSASYSATEQTDLSLKGELSVGDVDGGSGIETVTLSVSEGILNVTAGGSGAIVTNSGTGAVTIKGTAAAINALLNTDGSSTVAYNANLDAPGASATLTLTIHDGGHTGLGGDKSATAIATINVTAVNDAPALDLDGNNSTTTGADYHAAYLAGGPAVPITDSDVLVSDPDNPTNLQSATITLTNAQLNDNLSISGSLPGGITTTGYDSGTGILVLTGPAATLAEWQAALRQVVYSSTDANPDVTTRAITIQLDDGQTSHNLSNVAHALIFYNQPPAIANLDGDSVTFTEDGAAVRLDAGSAALVTDSDSLSLDGGNLIVTITANGVAGEDVLSLDTSGAVSLPSGMVVGGHVLVGGTDIGTIATSGDGANGHSLIVSFNANATPANVSVLVDALTYANSNHGDPSTLTRTVSISVNDGDGGTSGIAQVTVAVTPANDAPTAETSGGATAASEQAAVVVDGGIAIGDVDDATLDHATVSIIDNFHSTEDLLSFTNDNATMGNITALYTGGTGKLALTSSGSTATLAQWQAALAAVTYTNTADAPNTASRTITFMVNDGTDNSTLATKTVSVTPVNDAPAVTTIAATLTLAEDAAPPLLFTSAPVVSDVDSANVVVTLTLADTTAGALSGAGPGTAGVYTVTGTLASVNGTLAMVKFAPAANYNGTTSVTVDITDGQTGPQGTNPHATVSITVTAVNDAPVRIADTLPTIAEDAGLQIIAYGDLTGNDATGPANESGQSLEVTGVDNAVGGTVTIAAGHIEFTPTANFNGTASFDYTVTDNGTTNGVDDFKSTTGHASFTITAVNDAPTVTNLPATLTLAEDAVPPLLFTTAPVVSDVDSANVTVTLTLADTAAGTLTGAGSGPAGVYTVSGTLASVNAALAAVKFAPAADYNGTTSVTIDITDGETGPQGSNPHAMVSITVTEANDAPVPVGDTLPTIAEDAGVQTITFDALTGNDGTGSGNESGQSLTVTDVGGAVGGTVVINGGHVEFTPTANFNGIASFDYTVTDNGTTHGVDDFKSTTGHASFAITAVNDAPVGASKTIPAIEDAGYAFTVADFGFTDPLDAGSTSGAGSLLAVRITSLPSRGTLLNNGDAVVADQFVSAADITAGHLVFKADPNQNGAGYASFEFKVQDDGGGTDLASSANTMTIDVAAVNDAPSGADVTRTLLEDGSYLIALSDFGFSDPSDTPSDAFAAVVITSLPSAGALMLNGNAVAAGQAIDASDIGSGLLAFAPGLNGNGTGYASFTFQVRDDGGGANTDGLPNTFTFDVTAQNDAPAVSGPVTLAAIDQNSGARTITQANLLVGVTDPDGPTLQAINLAIGVGGGTLHDNGDGTWGYTPDTDDDTSVSFTYAVTDNVAPPVAATATLDILPVTSAIPVTPGTSGNDEFTATSGGERFEAGAGIDTINFNFSLVDATITWSGNQVFVDTASSHTELVGFERFVFTDGTVNSADGNPLVDDLFYYSQNHDVWNAHVDADWHYDISGWHEGRDPSAFFSTSFYLSINQDVKAEGINPLTHFDQAGWKEGRAPSMSFDDAKYLAANPDVAAAGIDPLAHFLSHGAQEGRQPFALTQLLTADGFDYVYYLQQNPDVAAAQVDPLWHFRTTGWTEGRDPNALFDTSGYLAAYTDVAAANMNPFDHYNGWGWLEGRDPSLGFDTTAYLAANPDVAAAQVNPLSHYLHSGQFEGRPAHADGIWG